MWQVQQIASPPLSSRNDGVVYYRAKFCGAAAKLCLLPPTPLVIARRYDAAICPCLHRILLKSRASLRGVQRRGNLSLSSSDLVKKPCIIARSAATWQSVPNYTGACWKDRLPQLIRESNLPLPPSDLVKKQQPVRLLTESKLSPSSIAVWNITQSESLASFQNKQFIRFPNTEQRLKKYRPSLYKKQSC